MLDEIYYALNTIWGFYFAIAISILSVLFVTLWTFFTGKSWKLWSIVCIFAVSFSCILGFAQPAVIHPSYGLIIHDSWLKSLIVLLAILTIPLIIAHRKDPKEYLIPILILAIFVIYSVVWGIVWT